MGFPPWLWMRSVMPMAVSAGIWYDSALIEDDISALQQKVSEKGYPHVQVKADSKFPRTEPASGSPIM